MDDGKGNFVPVSQETVKKVQSITGPDESRCFQVGSIIHLNGSIFEVASIRKKKLILKLLPNAKAEQILETIRNQK